MKRKRGKAKLNPKKASLARTNEAVSNVGGLNTDYSLEDLMCEYNVTMETETPLEEPSKNDHQAALEQESVAGKVNSVHNTNAAFLGNLSKFAASTPARSSRGADTFAEYDSRMVIETPRAEASMSARQTDSVKGGGAVNGRMGFFPNALREIVISVISELSKEAGDVTAKVSSGITSKPINNAPTFFPQGERNIQEVSPNLNPQYEKQELNASLSVIKKIMKLKAAEPFNVPIDPIALGIPDYFEVIDTPMDFGTICYNLENGYNYLNSEDVYKDVQLIWKNCSKYNRAGDYILELMKQVKTNFMKYWTAAGLHMKHILATNGYAPLSASTESTMMDNIHRKGLPVPHVLDEVGASLVQKPQPSSIRKRAYQPHLGSNEPAGVNASKITGNSHLQLSTEPNMRRSMRRRENPVVPLSDNTRPGQTQFNPPLAIENHPQLNSNQPQPSQKHTEVNTSNAAMLTRSRSRINLRSRGGTRGLSVDKGRHVQDVPYEPIGDELSEDGIDIRSHGNYEDMVDEDISSDDAMLTKGKGRINQPSRGGVTGLSIRSHRHDQDMVDEDTPSDDGGDSKGEGSAPRPPEDLEQKIPVIVYKGMLVVPPQEDGKKIPGVSAGILNAIQGKFVVGKEGPTWKKVPEEMKEYYFREWNRHYKCDDEFSEREVKKIWNVMAGEQYKRMCYRARQQFRHSGHPYWCGEGEWKRHLSFYANENMKKRSEQARKNRNSDHDGLGKSKHSGGSRSFVYHELMMKKENPEKVITEDEVFLRTHKKKGTDEFIDAKSKKIFEDYIARKDGPGFDSNAWIEASGGIAKNRVYGFGSLATASSILCKTPPSSSHVHLKEDLKQSQKCNSSLKQSQNFNEKVCEKVDKLRAEIRSEIKAQLQSEHAEQMEKLKADFELRLQEAIRSVTASQSQYSPPGST